MIGTFGISPASNAEWSISRKSVSKRTGTSKKKPAVTTTPDAGAFGSTIAHGFLTLSLLPKLLQDVYRVDGVQMGVNYGLNRVRFTSPVPVDSRVRAKVDLVDVTDVSGGVQLTTTVTIEIEGSEKPALVAEWLTRLYV